MHCLEECINRCTVNDQAKCDEFSSDLCTAFETYTEAAGLHEIKKPPKKTALCCLLFHKFFPYPMPFCGWTGSATHGSPVHKYSQMGALHKNTTLFCGKCPGSHTLSAAHIADPQSLWLLDLSVCVCVCNHAGAVSRQTGRITGRCVNA